MSSRVLQVGIQLQNANAELVDLEHPVASST